MAAEPEAEALPREELVAAGLQVEATPGREHVLAGVRSVVRLVLNLRTPAVDPDAPPRAPLRVACVLDRSGSMGGAKLDFAKRAAKKLVKHLVPGDTLHFVAYDDQVDVVFEDGDLSEPGKEQLRDRVDGLRPGGTTNLFGGLQAAVRLLGGDPELGADASASKVEASTAPSGEVRRIFLFSDGCVNAGVTDRGRIRRSVGAWAAAGISTSTFGIGLDFDEPLMRGIAEAGGGRYTFLGTARDIPRLVSKSVHDLLGLYASEATLDVRGGDHATVARLHGAGDDEEDAGADAGAAAGLLRLGDLHFENERRALLELEVAPPGGSAEGTAFSAARWTLEFVRDGARAQLTGDVQLRATQDRRALGEEASVVRASFAVRRATELEEAVAARLAGGDRAAARDLKQQQLTLLEEALEAARLPDGEESADAAMLEQVLERARRVARQLESGQSSEAVRRQCVQEQELNRAMSVCGWRDGCDSECSGETDVANLADLDGLVPPRGRRSSPSGSRSSSSGSRRSLGSAPSAAAGSSGRSRSPSPPAASTAPRAPARPRRSLVGRVTRLFRG